MQIDIVVESAEPREVMHFALLFGYGASIINPYMSFAIIEQLVETRVIQQDFDKAQENYIHAINKGLAKDPIKNGDQHPAELPGCPDFRSHWDSSI